MSPVPPQARPPNNAEIQPSVDEIETEDIHHLHAPIMREQAEPRDGFEPIPLWLTVFYGIIIFWGGYYLASYNGGFQPDVYNELRPLGMSRAEPAERDPLQQGQRLYTVNCSACHQQTGQGVAGQFPPLAGSQWVVGDHGRLVRILLHGLQGPVEVRGETYNGNMPAFGKKLDDEQLSIVLTYIRQAWGNRAVPVSGEVIASIRGQMSERRAAWTAAELKEINTPPLTDIRQSTDKEVNAASDDEAPVPPATPNANPAE